VPRRGPLERALARGHGRAYFDTAGDKLKRAAAVAKHGGAGQRLRALVLCLLFLLRLRSPGSLDRSVSDPTWGVQSCPWAETPLGNSNDLIAQICGAKAAIAGTLGTTHFNRLAVYTLGRPGRKLIVDRGAHLSIHQAIAEIGVVPVYVPRRYDPALGISLPIVPADLAATLAAHRDADGAIIGDPDYFGPRARIREIVAICKEAGKPLFVDAAHGTCIGFHPALPMSAIEAGADLVTLSMHKATEAASQASLLLINDEALKPRLLDVLNATAMFTTSPNTEILLDVERAMIRLDREGPRLIGAALREAERMREAIADIPGLAVWGRNEFGRAGIAEWDPLRVVVDLCETGWTGWALERRLALEFGVVPELGTQRHLLFIVTYGNGRHDVRRAVRALRAMTRTRGSGAPEFNCVPGIPPMALTPRDAFWALRDGRRRRVATHLAAGRTSGETISVYPPGRPIIVAGEVLTEDAVAYLAAAAKAGAHLKGATDSELRTMTIVEEE
jgi:lysine decarboxylase